MDKAKTLNCVALAIWVSTILILLLDYNYRGKKPNTKINPISVIQEIDNEKLLKKEYDTINSENDDFIIKLLNITPTQLNQQWNNS